MTTNSNKELEKINAHLPEGFSISKIKPSASRGDYKKVASPQEQKEVNKIKQRVKAVYLCPLCIRNYDTQDYFTSHQELGNHLFYGHHDYERNDFLLARDEQDELDRGIRRY